jgi:hypothetical protein
VDTHEEPEQRNLQENFKVTPSRRRAIAALCKGYGMTKAELLEHMLARQLAAARKAPLGWISGSKAAAGLLEV